MGENERGEPPYGLEDFRITVKESIRKTISQEERDNNQLGLEDPVAEAISHVFGTCTAPIDLGIMKGRIAEGEEEAAYFKIMEEELFDVFGVESQIIYEELYKDRIESRHPPSTDPGKLTGRDDSSDVDRE